jgi:hypothetical protein
MLSFLLDEHLSPAVAVIIVNLRQEIQAVSVHDWDQGAWVGKTDEELLRAASLAGLTLVSYDQRTVPALLHRWAESGQCHAGVVFVDERTVAPNDFPLLARSLIRFWDLHGHLDRTNRLAFLRRAS